MSDWQPKGTGYSDPWIETNGFKLRYKKDSDDDLQEFLLALDTMSDEDCHRNHVHFWYSASRGRWIKDAKFRDDDNNLHRLKDLSAEDALWVVQNL